jgi:hypothetical protein
MRLLQLPSSLSRCCASRHLFEIWHYHGLDQVACQNTSLIACIEFEQLTSFVTSLDHRSLKCSSQLVQGVLPYQLFSKWNQPGELETRDLPYFSVTSKRSKCILPPVTWRINPR